MRLSERPFLNFLTRVSPEARQGDLDAARALCEPRLAMAELDWGMGVEQKNQKQQWSQGASCVIIVSLTETRFGSQ